MAQSLKIGVVGATGMVGKSFMATLEDRKFPVAELRPFASENSLGKTVRLQGKDYAIQILKPGCFDGLDLVFFSSGDEISQEWAPIAEKAGAWAVDNSAAFRMDERYPLVVPEVNGDLVAKTGRPTIVANPNCSTIQLVVALDPLMKKFGLESVRVASYQAVSGAGQAAYDELLESVKTYDGKTEQKAVNFVHPIAFNCIPQIGSFNDLGFSSEEMKIMKETRKILRNPEVKVSAFTVRVPVLNGHAEAVWVTLKQKVTRDQVVAALSEADGIVVQDDLKTSTYPQQRLASGQDPVYVGRIHQDLDDPNTWLMWVVADNIRKGAALNGIQIAERIFDIRH
ncbi:MAG: aspartate-semialdehyde dehydrogenase [Bdellovibrionaceae bacterium]|nr:aspartate-semialdehyde dehydrogenase [Pseudobdellovibrionaceae bacterium]